LHGHAPTLRPLAQYTEHPVILLWIVLIGARLLVDEHRCQVARYARLTNNFQSSVLISHVLLELTHPRLNILVEVTLLRSNDVKIVIPEHFRHVFGGTAIVQYPSRPLEHGIELGLDDARTRADIL